MAHLHKFYGAFAMLWCAAPVAAQATKPTASVIFTTKDLAPIAVTGGRAVASDAAAVAKAQQTLIAMREYCQMVERDGVLYVVFDSSTPFVVSQMPKSGVEWMGFAGRVHATDSTFHQRSRAVSVLRDGKVMAEVSAVGVVVLK